jgi:tetratricopeptide (TPR) repeat protein
MRSSLRLSLLLGSFALLIQTYALAGPPASTAGQNSQPGSSPASNSNSNPSKQDADSAKKTPNLAPPHSDRVNADDLGSDLGDSSSKDTQEDLTPPDDDAKAHPKSSNAVAEAEAGISAGGVSEFHTWDPHKAAKDIEVGDFYFKRKNYRAAQERYREALHYKDDDAIATIKLAISLEKLGVTDDALAEYQSYLKILPHGPEADQAQKAIDRLKAPPAAAAKP